MTELRYEYVVRGTAGTHRLNGGELKGDIKMKTATEEIKILGKMLTATRIEDEHRLSQIIKDLIRIQEEAGVKTGVVKGSTGDEAGVGGGTKNFGDGLKIVYKHNKPYGIRNWTGFLFFFTDVHRYTGQDERYRQEVEEQYKLADFLFAALKDGAGSF